MRLLSFLVLGADGGSSDGATTFIWRIRGTNGWNSGAAIGSQGAQFLTSTHGFSAISLQFDAYSTTAGEGKLQVEYTIDGSTWLNASNLSLGSASSSNTAIATNSSSPNTVTGSYFVFTGAQAWHNGLTVDLSGVSGVANDPNFGIRIVNAATGADCVNLAGAAINNTSGNWRLDEVKILGSSGAVAPSITLQPVSQLVNGGSSVTFTAAASGTPAPTAEWLVETSGSSTFVDTGVSGTSYTFTASPSNNGSQYEAVFTNGVNPSATTNPATLTVPTAPLITTQPNNQSVGAGSAASFTSVAFGSLAPTVEWFSEAPGASTFTDTGVSTTTYTISQTTEGQNGTRIEAVFTSTGSVPVTSNIATLTVTGTPIAQWVFTGGEAPPANGATSQGTGNSPFPTFGPQSNIASTNGLFNDYTGVNAFSESDVLIERSTLNPSFSEFDWRVRSGNGQGPTGSPGTPEGWSQNAPEWDATTSTGPVNAEANSFEQGVQFDVDTTGYSGITLHFDWNQGGISDMQPVYSLDGGSTWIALPNSLIEQTAPSGDFYGITSTTVPTGITVNLQGIAGANNNPNFELQLDAQYNPTLPLISDGNLLDPTVHGQYASGIAGTVNAQQVLQFNSGINDGDTVPLTYNGGMPVNFTYSSDPSTFITNLTAALTTLVGAGNFSILPTNYTSTTESSATLLQPLRDGLGNKNTDMTVTFKGTLASTNVATITTTNSNVVIATWVKRIHQWLLALR